MDLMCSLESSVLSLSITTFLLFLFFLLGAAAASSRPSRPPREARPSPKTFPPLTSMLTSLAPKASPMSSGSMSSPPPKPSSANPSLLIPPALARRAAARSALSLAPRTISTSENLPLLLGEPPMPSSSKKLPSAPSGLKAAHSSPAMEVERRLEMLTASSFSWVATTQSEFAGRASRSKGSAKASPLFSAPSLRRTMPVPVPASTNSPKLATLIWAGLVVARLLASSMSTTPGRKAILIFTRASLQSAMRYLTFLE
mmetsp:Transcript_26488/g.50192  ORF Transcript_26488/g.50192 Transcript_26488/m.50192 type:complete len:257 (+) Transcript_26488:663-1433(+)